MAGDPPCTQEPHELTPGVYVRGVRSFARVHTGTYEWKCNYGNCLRTSCLLLQTLGGTTRRLARSRDRDPEHGCPNVAPKAKRSHALSGGYMLVGLLLLFSKWGKFIKGPVLVPEP